MRYLVLVFAPCFMVACATVGADAPSLAATPRFAGPVVPQSQSLEPVDTVSPSLTDDVRARFHGRNLTVSAVVCVDKDGDVKQVTVDKCDPAAKDAVASALARWRFKAPPVPVCFAANYDFTVGE